MAKDKQKDKEHLVEELMDLYEDRHDENGWNNNDRFILSDRLAVSSADGLRPGLNSPSGLARSPFLNPPG
jgi:hypothetical protein